MGGAALGITARCYQTYTNISVSINPRLIRLANERRTFGEITVGEFDMSEHARLQEPKNPGPWLDEISDPIFTCRSMARSSRQFDSPYQKLADQQELKLQSVDQNGKLQYEFFTEIDGQKHVVLKTD